MLLKAVQCWPAATKGFLKGERGVGVSHDITWISSEKCLSLRSLGGPWVGGNLRAALAPTLQLQYPREYNMCDTSLWGWRWWDQSSRSHDKALKYNAQWELICVLQYGVQTLKLFSLGLRLMMTLKVSYGSSVPLWMLLVMSCWYWLGSSHTRNVLASPRSLGFGSGPRSRKYK